MGTCSEVTWMHWSSWAIYIIFMVFAIKWMYTSYAKSALDRAIDQLSADAVDDIQDFLDSPVGGEVGVSQYLEARLNRLRRAIEDRVESNEDRS